MSGRRLFPERSVSQEGAEGSASRGHRQPKEAEDMDEDEESEEEDEQEEDKEEEDEYGAREKKRRPRENIPQRSDMLHSNITRNTWKQTLNCRIFFESFKYEHQKTIKLVKIFNFIKNLSNKGSGSMDPDPCITTLDS